MVGDAATDQVATVSRALDLGIDYFDTAATYGNGASERALGAALRTLGATDRVRLATKVRLTSDDLGDVRTAVRRSFAASCQRLGVQRVALLQLHNSITKRRGDLPTSLTVDDVLGTGGVIDAFDELRREQRVQHLGFTGLGDMRSLSLIVRDGPFAAAQIPLNILLPMAGDDATAGSLDVDYRQLAQLCHQHNVGVIGIRAFAGGALLGQAPSPHTYKTKFFTLDVYQRDCQRADRLARQLPESVSLAAATIRYVLGNLGATTVLIGFASPQQVEQAAAFAEEGPLDESLIHAIAALA